MTVIRYRRIGAFLWWGAYQVVEDFTYQSQITGHAVECEDYALDPSGLLRVRQGYVWDGPTGAIKTRSFVAGSCVHDVFCEMINAGLLPRALQCMADEEMHIINGLQRMSAIRRAVTYRAVRGYQLRKKKPFVPKIYSVEI